MFLHTYWLMLSTFVHWMSVVSYCNMALILTALFQTRNSLQISMAAERLHCIVPYDEIHRAKSNCC